MDRTVVAGLPDPRRQAEVAREPVGRRESRDVPDRRNDRRCDHGTDPGDAHQFACAAIIERDARQGTIQLLQLGIEPVQFIKTS